MEQLAEPIQIVLQMKADTEQAVREAALMICSAVRDAKDPADRLSGLALVYWAFEEVINTADLKEFFGVDTKQLKNACQRYPVTVQCASCDGRVPITSRTSFKQAVAEHPYRKRGWKPENICPECKERKEQSAREKEAVERPERERQYAETRDRQAVELLRLQTMPYADYLQTEHWKERRQEALRRAKWRCQLCNAQDVLNVHHRTYERRGCERPDDLIALCRSCHEHFHEVTGVAG
jgi:hypothetical protein